ncbi:MAG: DNA mismatch repair protein MutS, partial [Myxococcota bacterium]|nr:DNA mismatch repair protein MutS [Myxococcota bacterium]
DPTRANYIAHVRLSPTDGLALISFLDMLAGELLVTEASHETLIDELIRMSTREVILDEKAEDLLGAKLSEARIPSRRLDEGAVNPATARDRYLSRFGELKVKGVRGEPSSEHLMAIEELIAFCERTQRRVLPHLMRPVAYRLTDYLIMDEATRRNLELVRTQRDGDKRGSLLWHLNACRTAMGSRLLERWLLFPFRTQKEIDGRLDDVEALKRSRECRDHWRVGCESVRDIERLLGRVAVGRANPKDLHALRASLRAAPALRGELSKVASPIGKQWRKVDLVEELTSLLDTALADDPPTSTVEGGIFALGYQADLDRLIQASTQGHTFLAELEAREREKTGIGTLKVRFNKVFGYYIEVSRAHVAHVPDHYVRKQTLVNAERYITDELKEFEVEVLSADERRRVRESELFEALIIEVAAQLDRMRSLSRLIAQTDATMSLAQVADEYRYVRPKISKSRELRLKASRHPVVERLLPGGGRFIPNDVTMSNDERRMLIVTGPNMGGKSTIMRQVALTTVLAHMGSFVPAAAATVCLCDRVFTRVGASDDLGKGQSTFMVEMLETSTILREASKRSLVILDEIGRGTSTFDGVSIAWAVAEFLYDKVGSLCMFATHYHELTELAQARDAIVNTSLAVKQRGKDVVFLRELRDGSANKSYGIQVAGLAGVPGPVLERADTILRSLEGHEEVDNSNPRGPVRMPQLSLFEGGHQLSVADKPARTEIESTRAPEGTEQKVIEELENADLNRMTPLESLMLMDRLQKELKRG